MKTDNRSEIRSKLWRSAEMAHVRYQIIMWVIFWVLCMLAYRSRAVLARDGEFIFCFINLIFAVFVGFWLWRVLQIFRCPEEYVFCRTQLIQPCHFPLVQGMFTFMGIIEDGGSRFSVETHAIFHERGVGLLMEDYVGSTVTLAWNRRTGMVVVIG